MAKKSTETEMLFTNGTVLTMERPDATSEALLVRGSRVAAVGSEREVAAYASADAVVVDLGGGAVMPGFNDSHIHATFLGAQYQGADLNGLSGPEIVDSLRERFFADGHAPEQGTMLTGYGWDYEWCPAPHRDLLDAAFPDHPVVLQHYSGHRAWANSRALAKFGLSEKTPDWERGGLERDAQGSPTGIISEPGGNRKIQRQWLRSSLRRKEIRNGLTEALPMLARCGITTVQDNTWFPPVVSELQRLFRRGELSCRFSCWSLGPAAPMELLFGLKRFKPKWFGRGPRKYFIDGAFSSYNAWLTEPYAEDPRNYGEGYDSATIIRWLERAAKRGRQIACHSIGDRATREYCDALERVAANRPTLPALRPRIEHGQLIAGEDIERLAQLGAVVSAQPYAAANPERDAELLGRERSRRAYPYRSLLEAGVPLAFGSDAPSERSFNPLEGVKVAATRESLERISVAEALFAYTAGSAYAEFTEEEKGSLLPGYLADLVVLSADPLQAPPDRIDELTVNLTMVGGRVVYGGAGIAFGGVPPSEPDSRSQIPIGPRRAPAAPAKSGNQPRTTGTPQGTEDGPDAERLLIAHGRETWLPLMGGNFWR